MTRFLIYCLLLLTIPVFAQTSTPENGKVSLDFGELYVPKDLNWEQKSEKLQVGVGTGENPLRVAIAHLKGTTEVENATAVKLYEEHLRGPLELGSEGSTELEEALLAPYPWPGSLELRVREEQPTAVYVASGSNRTLLIGVTGPNAYQTANRIAASFKENLETRRSEQAQQGGASGILSHLSTGSTFILLLGFFVPMGVTLFVNRRNKTSKNPYKRALQGLCAGLVLALLFNFVFLSRFSWAGSVQQAQALGSTLARFALLFVIGVYLSSRWGHTPVRIEE